MLDRESLGLLEGKGVEQTKDIQKDFPGGTVAENSPGNAEDSGSITSPGRPHMPWSN